MVYEIFLVTMIDICSYISSRLTRGHGIDSELLSLLYWVTSSSTAVSLGGKAQVACRQVYMRSKACDVWR